MPPFAGVTPALNCTRSNTLRVNSGTPVNRFGRDELTDSGVTRLHQIYTFRYRHSVTDAADMQSDIDRRFLVDIYGYLVEQNGFQSHPGWL